MLAILSITYIEQILVYNNKQQHYDQFIVSIFDDSSHTMPTRSTLVNKLPDMYHNELFHNLVRTEKREEGGGHRQNTISQWSASSGAVQCSGPQVQSRKDKRSEMMMKQRHSQYKRIFSLTRYNNEVI